MTRKPERSPTLLGLTCGLLAWATSVSAQDPVVRDFSDDPMIIEVDPPDPADPPDRPDINGSDPWAGDRASRGPRNPPPPPRPDAPERRGQALGSSVDGTYNGGWKGDKPDGVGTKRYEDGSRYEGNWHEGDRQGQGVLKGADGRVIYEGEWSKSERSGQGSFHRASGLSYTGGWSDDLPSGSGHLIDPQAGTDYVGTLAEGRFTGWGHVRYTKAGEAGSYTGRFNKGAAAGSGTVIYRGGRSYTGDMKFGRPHGEGVALDSTGEMTYGYWAEGKLDGNIFRVDPSGKAFGSIWKDGSRVGAETALGANEGHDLATRLWSEAGDAFYETFKGVEQRYAIHSELGLIDPAYTTVEQWVAQGWLATSLQQAAGQVLAAGAGPAGDTAALALLRDGYQIARFSQGFSTGGYERTFVVLKDGIVEAWNITVEFVRDPKQALDTIVEIYAAVSSPGFTGSVARFFSNEWARFVEADAMQQGDMVRSVVDEVVSGALGGAGLGIIGKGTIKASKLGLALRKLGRAAKGKTGEFLESQLRFLTEGLGNRRNAVELIAGGRVVEATSPLQYELLKRDLRVREIFTETGALTRGAIDDAREIIPGSRLGDRLVVTTLTRDGSNIADWAKCTTRSYEVSGQPVSVHFYRHQSGRVNLDIGYKVVFDSP